MSHRPLLSGSYAPDLRVYQLSNWGTDDSANKALTAVQRVSGVKRAEFNHNTGRLIVLGNINDEAILAAVRELGLEISPEAGSAGEIKDKPGRRRLWFRRDKPTRRKPPKAVVRGEREVAATAASAPNKVQDEDMTAVVDAEPAVHVPVPRQVGGRSAPPKGLPDRPELDQPVPGRVSMRVVATALVIVSFLAGILLSVIKMSADTPTFTIPTTVWIAVMVLAIGTCGWAFLRLRAQGIIALPKAVGEVDAYVVAGIVVLGAGMSVSWWQGLFIGALIAASHYVTKQVSHRLHRRVADPLAAVDVVFGRLPGQAAWERVPLGHVVPGTTVRLQPGDMNPADGRVVAGEATVSLEHVNGDVIPVVIQENMPLLAGAVVRSGTVDIRVDESPDRSLIRLLRRQPLLRETKEAALAGPFARRVHYYSSTVLYVAFAVMIIPLVFLGDALAPWVHRAIGLLVLTPATALFSVRTLPVMAATARAATLGIAVRSGQQLHRLWLATRLVLTENTLVNPNQYLVEVHTLSHMLSEQQAVQRAASLVAAGNMDVWQGLVNAGVAEKLPLLDVTSVAPVPGFGVQGDVEIDGEKASLIVGHTSWLQEQGVRLPADADHIVEEAAATGAYVLWLADGTYALAAFIMGKRAWDGSRRFIARLDRFRFGHVTLVSAGDAPDAERIGTSVEIDDVRSGLSPNALAKCVADWQTEGENIVSVGTHHDYRGPLRTGKAHIWLGTGTHMPTDAKCITIIDNDPAKVLSLFGLSKSLDQTDRVLTAIVLVGKACLLIAAGIGRLPLWLLAVLDAGLSGGVILATLRLLRFRR